MRRQGRTMSRARAVATAPASALPSTVAGPQSRFGGEASLATAPQSLYLYGKMPCEGGVIGGEAG